MTFELTMTNLISLAGLFFGALWALLKVIGAQAERRANEKFAALQASLATLSQDMRREASTARELFGESSSAYQELASEADQLRDQVVGLQDFAHSVCRAPVSTFESAE